jgi:uncharacterized membrane protein YgcG
MRFQDPSTAQPREPTLAEQRARRQALADQERQEIAEQEARAEAERKAATRRKVLIGGGVTVGLVAVVATWYVAAASTETVNAVCTDSNNVVQPDEYCDDGYARTHGGHYDSVGGLWIVPLPGGGYSQYRYNYGGTGVVGQPVSGGTYTKPSGNTTVKTNSGKTVQRGGFGISGKSSGGSGKSGGS